jgi:predicted ribonuclease YlaK
MASGYIYCFSNESMSGVYKIGFTTRSPIVRLKDANSSDTWRPPNLYKLEFAKLVENCKEKERIVHNLLEKFNSRISSNREFFRTSLDNIKIIFDMIDGEWYNESTDNEYNQHTLENDLINNIIRTKTKNITPRVILTSDPIYTRVTKTTVSTDAVDYITCSVCSKIYCSVKNYNNHIERNRCKEPTNGFSCKYCSKVFTRNYNKNSHQIVCNSNPNELLKLRQENAILKNKIKVSSDI